MSHMVQFKDLINVGILNAEWVGFQGDSEYVDENGEVQLGYWSFVEVLDEPADYPWTINDKIPKTVKTTLVWSNSIIKVNGYER